MQNKSRRHKEECAIVLVHDCNQRLQVLVNPRNNLYLTDFLNRTFAGENARIFDFCGGKKLKPAPVYHAKINYASLCRQSDGMPEKPEALSGIFVAQIARCRIPAEAGSGMTTAPYRPSSRAKNPRAAVPSLAGAAAGFPSLSPCGRGWPLCGRVRGACVTPSLAPSISASSAS